MTNTIGRRVWAVAEGYIPPASTAPTPELTSHETICILNAGEEDAHVKVTIYFADRAPVGPYRFAVPAQRTRHLCFNEFRDPEMIPKARLLPASSSLMCRWWCSAPGSTAGRRRWRCSAPWRSQSMGEPERHCFRAMTVA